MQNRSSLLSRLYVLLGLVMLLPVAISLQMARVGVIEGEGLRELWSSQAIESVPIPAERGAIYDRNGMLLASNRVRCQVAVDPKYPGGGYSVAGGMRSEDGVGNKGLMGSAAGRSDVVRERKNERFGAIAQTLSSYTGVSEQVYLDRIRRAPERSRYVVLERSVSMLACDDLELLNDKSLIVEEQYKRRYHFGTLSAHMLGYVDHQMHGVTGLEAYYDAHLRGEDGVQQVRRDRANRIFAYVGAPRQSPRMGYSLQTTIDAHLQAVVEEELELGIERFRAASGSVIVMNPKTGEVLAMANAPTFNPNDPASADPQFRRNRAIADMIEPGSTFKLVTTLAAIEQGVVDPEEWFETPESGRLMIRGQWMRDHDPLGSLRFRDAITKSSNIVFSEVAQRIEPETYYQYARNMGFGTATHIDLPNEKAGRLQKPYEWSGVTLPWMSIGYEVQTTPLQILQAYAALANGGKLMRPYIVKEVVDEHNRIVEKTTPSHVRDVAKQKTIDTLIPLFESVLSDSGTASWGAVEGLRIAGKTGTAQKYIDGRYTTKYRASFAGFFPVDDPSYAILVLLDEPKVSYYGGYTSGAIFKEIASRIPGMDAGVRQTMQNSIVRVDSLLRAPSLLGLSREEAEEKLHRSGMTAVWKEDEGIGPVFSDAGNAERKNASQGNAGQGVTSQGVTSQGDAEQTGASKGHEVAKASVQKRSALVDEGIEHNTMVVHQHPAPGDRLEGRGITLTWRSYPVTLTGVDPRGASASTRTQETSTRNENNSLNASAPLVVVPDLEGLPMRKAMVLAMGAGLTVHMNGSGVVASQFPNAGDRMRRGRTLVLRGNRVSLQTRSEGGAR